MAVCAVMLAAAMFMGAADVVLGSVFGKYIVGTVEISQVCVAVVAFLAFPSVTAMDSHVRVDIIAGKLKGWALRLSQIVTTVITFLMCLFFAHTAWTGFVKSWLKNETIPSAIYVPLYPVRFMALAAFVACCVIVIVKAVQAPERKR